jgi:uncharacterized Zn finger protein (UPF0148 family)
MTTKRKRPVTVNCPVCGALMAPPKDVEVYTGAWWDLIKKGETPCPVCKVTNERKRKEAELREFQKRRVEEYVKKDHERLRRMYDPFKTGFVPIPMRVFVTLG